jgi:hypothetical protein
MLIMVPAGTLNWRIYSLQFFISLTRHPHRMKPARSHLFVIPARPFVIPAKTSEPMKKSATPAHAAKTHPVVESKCSQYHEVLLRFAPRLDTLQAT